MSGLPHRYYDKLDEEEVFKFTNYNFRTLAAVCEKLARQAVIRSGGHVEKDATGDEILVIPVKPPVPNAFENIRQPGPIAGSKFTPDEMKQIKEGVNKTPKP